MAFKLDWPWKSRRPVVEPGIDVLEQSGFKQLQGRRVGLLSHPAGVNRCGRHTVEVLKRGDGVQLAALFGPEHSFTGNDRAENPVMDRHDPSTGLTIYSLYGDRLKPTPEILAGLDVMVIDLQEIGVRSYTYISCLKLVMEACFELGVEVIVLDRPNPLGGRKVDGPVMDGHRRNYLGAFPMPYVHGLTIGEIARMALDIPGWLDISEEIRRHARLTVIAMRGWKRTMRWRDTGLRWTPTSPAIQTIPAAEGYGMTGLGCLITGFRHGYGTRHPFRLLSHIRHPVKKIRAELQARALPGLAFTSMNVKGVRGLYIGISDWDAWRPTELSFHLMQMACEWSDRNPFVCADESTVDLFNRHVGSDEWWEAITTRGKNINVTDFVTRWGLRTAEFHHTSSAYWLY